MRNAAVLWVRPRSRKRLHGLCAADYEQLGKAPMKSPTPSDPLIKVG